MTLRMPGASVATGFSAKTCLPFSIAYVRCAARKCGGVVSSTTSTPPVDHLLIRIEADELAFRRTVDFVGEVDLLLFELVLQRGHMRVHAVFKDIADGNQLDLFLSAISALNAAPVPRPRRSADPADLDRVVARCVGLAHHSRSRQRLHAWLTADVLMKSRREVALVSGFWNPYVCLPEKWN